MGTRSICSKQNKNYTIDSVMRWILFGVLIVVIPPLVNGWYRIIVGLEVEFSEYVPDMLLAVLSVSCNLLNTCVDAEKKIARILRWGLGIVFGIIALWCWGLFFVVRILPQDLLGQNYQENVSRTIFYFSTLVIIACAVIGIIIEVYTLKKANMEVNNEK